MRLLTSRSGVRASLGAFHRSHLGKKNLPPQLALRCDHRDLNAFLPRRLFLARRPFKQTTKQTGAACPNQRLQIRTTRKSTRLALQRSHRFSTNRPPRTPAPAHQRRQRLLIMLNCSSGVRAHALTEWRFRPLDQTDYLNYSRATSLNARRATRQEAIEDASRSLHHSIPRDLLH